MNALLARVFSSCYMIAKGENPCHDSIFWTVDFITGPCPNSLNTLQGFKPVYHMLLMITKLLLTLETGEFHSPWQYTYGTQPFHPLP